LPDWLLLPASSEQALIRRDAREIHTQEQRRIDLVCDGEFSRFDVNHPEPTG
jgi:5-methyltetrahydropteroyltriglutamate--homocysteine methyltransferase